MRYDTIIIGAGPAGLSAAVYAIRAGLKIKILESNYVAGGQILLTDEVDNYLGLAGTNGFDLGMKFKEHVEKLGVKADTVQVDKIEKTDDGFLVHTAKEAIEAKTVLVATGASYRKLEVKGEEKLMGRGVFFCATCDGAFYKDKIVTVVGGSYNAVEEAMYLSKICNKVYLVHRRDKLRVGSYLEEKLFACENIEILWDSIVQEISGEEKVSSIIIKNKNTDKITTVQTDGVLVAIGTVPQNDILKGMVDMDDYGYVKADETCVTSLNGLYVAGDLRTKQLRQVVTAVSDGANAITSAWNYIKEKE